MKSMKKTHTKNCFLTIIATITISSSLLPIEIPESTKKVAATLEKYRSTFTKKIQKIISCVKGEATCSPEEVKKTRAIALLLVTALTSLSLLTLMVKSGWHSGRAKKISFEEQPMTSEVTMVFSLNQLFEQWDAFIKDTENDEKYNALAQAFDRVAQLNADQKLAKQFESLLKKTTIPASYQGTGKKLYNKIQTIIINTPLRHKKYLDKKESS